jgi:hypothetical protein
MVGLNCVTLALQSGSFCQRVRRGLQVSSPLLPHAKPVLGLSVLRRNTVRGALSDGERLNCSLAALLVLDQNSGATVTILVEALQSLHDKRELPRRGGQLDELLLQAFASFGELCSALRDQQRKIDLHTNKTRRPASSRSPITIASTRVLPVPGGPQTRCKPGEWHAAYA